MHIYPDIEIRETPIRISLSSTLRKQHKGKWYLWDFYKQYDSFEKVAYTKEQRDMVIGRFHLDVYMVMLYGMVNPNIKDHFGNPMVKLDLDQRSESERLGFRKFGKPSLWKRIKKWFR